MFVAPCPPPLSSPGSRCLANSATALALADTGSSRASAPEAARFCCRKEQPSVHQFKLRAACGAIRRRRISFVPTWTRCRDLPCLPWFILCHAVSIRRSTIMYRPKMPFMLLAMTVPRNNILHTSTCPVYCEDLSESIVRTRRSEYNIVLLVVRFIEFGDALPSAHITISISPYL